ncbi:unnamed protein product [Mesocestoides corti]|uniref:P-type ATPase A domain-containing protein n=1 Tax=Mesocestoides corti TaxID=53468 RepID=A0A158QW15_MESCO|nr:unnamed protein product [Mesocestoides corti]
MAEDVNVVRNRSIPKTYAPLHLPHSLSYNLQLTYRDGKLSNVPVSLLVEGDVINLRPGQTVVCDCTLMTEANDEDLIKYGVDKKGLISFPIPTPEKVFFFRDRQNRRRKTLCIRSFDSNVNPQFTDRQHPSSSISTVRSQEEPRNVFSLSSFEDGSGRPRGRRSFLQNEFSAPEILNVTAPSDSVYMPRFESPRWYRFIESLKPIGLGLLLNNCQPKTREHYAAFADHLTWLTSATRQRFARAGCHIGGEAVAVVNNRCLCGLAYQMGFQDSALKRFSFSASLGIYKAIEKSDSRLIRPTAGTFNGEECLSDFRRRALRIQEAYATVPKDTSKEPMPVPNCFSVISRESTGSGYQVMTQGSGDLVTALCTSLWNGREVLPLVDAERSKMLDFYNQHVSTSYCLAFAYMPLVQSIPLVQDRRPDAKSANLKFFPVLKLPVNFELRSRLNTRPSSASTSHVESQFESLESVQKHLRRRLTRFTVARPSSSFLSATSSSGLGIRKGAGGKKRRRLRTCLRRLAFSCDSLPQFSRQTTRGVAFVSHQPHLEAFLTKNWRFGVKIQTRDCFLFICLSSNTLDATVLQDIFSKQIFLGMISLQYQAIPDIVETIRKLNQACIRFVHFSQVGFLPFFAICLTTLVLIVRVRVEFVTLVNLLAHVSRADRQHFPGTFLFNRKRFYDSCLGPLVHVELLEKVHSRWTEASNGLYHVAKENQLRSRVFAERLGLEADWNCHISLASSPSSATTLPFGEKLSAPRAKSSRVNSTPAANLMRRLDTSLEDEDGLPKSSAVAAASSTLGVPDYPPPPQPSALGGDGGGGDDDASTGIWVGFDVDADAQSQDPVDIPAASSASSLSSLGKKKRKSLTSASSSSSASSTSTSFDGGTGDEDNSEVFENQDAQEDAYNYVFANKSRLPCGIKNIRTHLENVDNVPLKVSLFTDCTPQTVGEMISILQEYGETVCVVGSCLSIANIELFFRGDTSIALFPLLPRVCGHEVNSSESSSRCAQMCNTERRLPRPSDTADSSLLDLAGRLIALGAPLVGRVDGRNFDLLDLISQAHASVNNIHLCIIFALASSFASALFYFLSLAFLPAFPVTFFSSPNQSPVDPVWLPPILLAAVRPIPGNVVGCITLGGHTLWLIVIVIPVLSVSIFGRNVERRKQLREPPVKRNEIFSRDRMRRLFSVTLARFLPSVIVCWALSIIQTFAVCPTHIDHRLVCLPPSQAHNDSSSTPIVWDYEKVFLDVTISQELPFFLLVTYIVLISFSYANAGQWINQWRRNTNMPWLISAVLILLSHSVYLIACFASSGKLFPIDRHWHLFITLACGLLWCPVLLLLNEAINWKDRV